MAESSGPRVLLDIADDGVATVTLNHPPLNIYDLQMRDELIDVFRAIHVAEDVRAVVFRAHGRAFSAGADLREFGTAGGVLAARAIRWLRDPWTPLWELPVPVVASLHGHCLGAGLEMALLCDLRVASPDCTLGLPEAKLGMLPSAGGTQSLARVIGPDAAFPLVVFAPVLAAHDALHMGVVDSVVEDPDREAQRVASVMAAIDRRLLSATRRCLRSAFDLPLESGLRREGILARSFSAESENP